MTDTLTRKIRAKCALDPKREYVNLTDMLATKEENARLIPIIDKLCEAVVALEETVDNGHHSTCAGNPDNHQTTSRVWNDAICDCGFIKGKKALRSLLEVGE